MADIGNRSKRSPICAPPRRPTSGPTRTRTSGSGGDRGLCQGAGYAIVEDEFYDAAVSGADPIAERPGFKAMLDRIAGNGVRCIIVESPDRFARDLDGTVYRARFPEVAWRLADPGDRAGLLHRRHADSGAGPSGARRHRAVREDSPGGQAQSRARSQDAAGEKCGGRKSYAEARPETVALARELRAKRLSLRRISAELAARGHLTANGRPYVATIVQAMLG